MTKRHLPPPFAPAVRPAAVAQCHAAPPNKVGPPAAAFQQARPIQAASAQPARPATACCHHAPPATRFLTAPPVQAAKGTSVHVPPPTSFQPTRLIQPALAPQPLQTRRGGVIQRMEDLIEDDGESETGGPTNVRPKFRASTKAYLYNGDGSRRMPLGELLIWQIKWGFHNMEEYKTEYIKCAECKLYYPQAAIHIDHKVDWAEYIKGSTTRKEQIDKYNEKSNLQMLCSFCNGAKQKNPDWHYTGGFRDGMYGP